MAKVMSAGDTMVLSPSRKRPAPKDDLPVSTPTKMLKSEPSLSEQKPSTPIISSNESMLSPHTDPNVTPHGNTSTPSDAQKRKKRTKEEIEQEKAQREAERVAKQQEREEKKRKKEEEEKVKEEERRKKQAERDAKKEVKEKERLEKEQEKQRKVEEQEKKERAQLKLKNFFSSKPSTKAVIRTQDPDPSTSITDDSRSAAAKQPTSEYESTFLPFSLPTHGQLAPVNPSIAITDPESTTIAFENVPSPDELPRLPRHHRRASDAGQPTTREILDALQGSFHNPIDLTAEAGALSRENALEALAHVRLTYLEFHEDVRPPFCGTWTKSLPQTQANRLRRNPWAVKLTGMDYDYDSEAEWEEPEEGEDILSDAEDEESEDEGDDMEGFIDDEEGLDPLAAKRPSFIRDLPPVCSGIHWEDVNGKLCPADPSASKADWSDLQMGFLLFPEPITVDPLSNQYWQASSGVPSPMKKGGPGLLGSALSTHRHALSDKTRKVNGVTPAPPQIFKASRLVAPEDMESFKAEIDGQDLTKIAMVEHLKKKFPKNNKDAIVNTLAAVAERESKRQNAKWRLKLS